MIRKTYHASECAKCVFQGKDQNVMIHVGVKVPSEGEASASAAWWDAHHASSGWIVQRVSATFSQTLSKSVVAKCPILFRLIHINRHLFGL